MCGFAAFFDPGRIFPPDLLASAERDLFHRGPDSGGILNEKGMALAFRRLSIIDLSEDANQPMSDASGNYSIVFNGEIYNYKEIKMELRSEGMVFHTSSDTEVILQGYIKWGEKILDKLEGMYAFAIVDRKKNRAFVARDPYGIKPLYVMQKGTLTAFASEMRVLTRLIEPEIDHTALRELLTFGWPAGEKSNLKGINRVQGGTYYIISIDEHRVKSRRFCDVLDLLGDEETDMTEDGAISIASEGLKDSIKAHLMSDVGYAVQLSGGIDSSIVAAVASQETDWPISSYSVSLGNHPLDEGKYRKMVVSSFSFKHHELPFGNREFADAFEKAIWHMEGPVPHLGCVMLMLTCEFIRSSNKVVLTGEGADEMFGGYERYKSWRRLALQEKLSGLFPTTLLPNRQPFLGIKRIKGKDAAVYASVYGDILSLNRMFPDFVPGPGARDIASKRFKDFLYRLFAVDQTAYLESLLSRQDKMSMACSVEARVPFVHLPFTRKINSIPREIIAPGGESKPILKKIAEAFFPREMIYRRKNGLLLPYLEWLKDPEGLGRFLDYLTSPTCKLMDYCAQGKLKNLVDRFRSGNDDPDLRWIIKLLNIEIWLRTSSSLARS